MKRSIGLVLPALFLLPLALPAAADVNRNSFDSSQLGPRPAWLVDQMSEGPLKDELQKCAERKHRFKPKDFSIGHRGAPLQFPEHTKESYVAAARMGAGILECDVTFTQDRELVCRHAQCDLHTTTNILATDLAGTCEVPFTPATFNDDGSLDTPATARCCTSAITLEEFKTLEGKMDAANTSATTVEEYLDGTADFRTDLYSGGGRGTLLTHAESIELFEALGVGMTPELKSPEVPMPFEGDYTQQDYAQQMIDEYKAAGVPPRRVWPQSFNYDDVLYWIENEPAYGRQAVFLDGRYGTDVNDPDAVAALKPSMADLAFDGVNILAPPMFMMLGVENGEIVPSVYAEEARKAGLDMIGWTTERSGKLAQGGGGFYYSTVAELIGNDGDILTVIDVLAQDVGIIGLFSDWSATTTFYANCKRTAKPQRYSRRR
jgi:glycerophosphoryl diester phosphodiesterase